MGFATALLKAGYGTAKVGAKASWGAAKFAVKHPFITAGIVGAGLYAAYSDKSPYNSPSMGDDYQLMNSRLESEMGAMENIDNGVAPMGTMSTGYAVRNQRLMESTNGLVQALSANRHGS